MTELDKAQVLLEDSSNTSTDIANETGINLQSLSNYRTNRTDLSKAKWEIIHKLANYYDDQLFAHNAGIGMNNFVARLALWFQEAYEDQIDVADSDEAIPGDRAMADVVNEIKNIVSNDKEIAVRLFDTFEENNEDDIG